MSSIRTGLIALLWPLCLGWSAVLFQDDFCAGDGWVEVERAYAFPEIRIDNCQYVFANAGTNAALMRHDMSLPETFTYTVSVQPVSADFSRIGILFCVNADGDGYAFSISSRGTYRLDAYRGGVAGTITGAVASAAVNISGVNSLTVSRAGRSVSLMANGIFLESLDDASFSGGGIGLVVSGGSTASFRAASVSDQATTPGEGITCVHDDFSSGAAGAWQVIWSPLGSCSFENGRCILNNTSSYGAHLFQAGSFAGASLSCVVTYLGGTGLYGLGFFEYDPGRKNAVTTHAYAFGISGARYHGVVGPDAGQIPIRGPTTHIHGSTGSKTDTLELRYQGGSYAFAVNGHILSTSSLPADFRVDGAGMYAGAGAQVAFDDFRAGGESCMSAAAAGSARTGRRQAPARAAAVYTPGGRRVRRFGAENAARGRLRRARGVYIVIYEDGEGSVRLAERRLLETWRAVPGRPGRR